MTPGQTDLLVKMLKSRDWLETQFITDNIWEVVHRISDEQRRYAHAIILTNKHLSVRNFLIKIGLTPKQYEQNQ